MNRREFAALFVGSTAFASASAAQPSDRTVGRGESEDAGAGRRDAGVETLSGRDAGTTSAGSTGRPDRSWGEFGPERVSGTGTVATGRFELPPGPVVATFAYEGGADFVAELVALDGRRYQDVRFAELTGKGGGSGVVSVHGDGPYVLDVEADGRWEVTLYRPADPAVQPLPAERSGTGRTALGPFAFDGPTRVEVTHGGDFDFRVRTVPLDPDTLGTTVFDRIGTFHGSTTVRVPGPAYVDVDADGPWTLRLSE